MAEAARLPGATRPSAGEDHTRGGGGISRLTRNRAVATRYDKPAVRYEATVRIAAISEWLRPDFLNSP